MEIEFSVEVKDPSKKILNRFAKPSDSILKNLVLLNYGMMCEPDVYAIDTGGTSRQIINSEEYSQGTHGHLRRAILYWYPGEESTRGIRVGEDDTPVTKEDYQLNWIDVISVLKGLRGSFEVVVGANEVVWTCKRNFSNLTSSDVLVKEIGIVVRYIDYDFLIVRDVIPTQTVPADGGGLTIQYTITFPY